MQKFIFSLIILGFISPCLCIRLNVGTQNGIYNVMDYGARGDGKTDDSQVYMFLYFSLYNFNILIFLVNFFYVSD
jgi:hypothetical protein